MEELREDYLYHQNLFHKILKKISKNIIFKNEPWQFEIKKWLIDHKLYIVHGCDFIIWEVMADRIGSQEYYHLHGKIKTTLCNMRSCLQNVIQLR